jgi:hypothetical protein
LIVAGPKPEAPELPWYLKPADGSVSIDFMDIPAKIDGGSVLEIVMREPRVQDQLSVEGKSAMRAEVAVFANLCDLPPEAIAGLSLKQYGRLQEAYASFLA